jgi:hypothetical protein
MPISCCRRNTSATDWRRPRRERGLVVVFAALLGARDLWSSGGRGQAADVSHPASVFVEHDGQSG